MGEDLSEFDRATSMVLTAAEIDLLELVRLGALPQTVLHHFLKDGREVVLRDAEGTPLSALSVNSITHVRSLPQGLGPAWDPTLRLAPESLQGQLSHHIALVSEHPPSIAELWRLSERAASLQVSSIFLCGLVSREAVDPGHVRPSGLIRSLRRAAESLCEQFPAIQVRVIAIPWPKGLIAVEALLNGYGFTEIVYGASSESAASLTDYPESSKLEIIAAKTKLPTSGAVVLFSGLSGSGKSTIARALVDALRDDGVPQVDLLDGDVLRRTTSSDLGFDITSRNEHLRRIGALAAKVASSGGVAIAAPIAPTREGRALARKEVEGIPFLLVYVSTPLSVCEDRDSKGLYARARRGELSDFTGISAPYEVPDDADLVIDTSRTSLSSAIEQVKSKLLPLIS